MHGQTIALARYFSELQSFSDLTVRFWEAAPWPSKNSVHHQTSSIAKGLTSLYTSLCNFPRVKTEPNPTFLALPNSPACQSCRARPIGAHALGARHATHHLSSSYHMTNLERSPNWWLSMLSMNDWYTCFQRNYNNAYIMLEVDYLASSLSCWLGIVERGAASLTCWPCHAT